MKPSIKDKLMRDYSGKPGIDMSIILGVGKGLEKQVPNVEKMGAIDMLGDGGDIMQGIEGAGLLGNIATAESMFSNISKDIDLMEDEEVLKLVHMITMKAASKGEDD